MYVDIVISNIFHLNKHSFSSTFNEYFPIRTKNYSNHGKGKPSITPAGY